MEAAPRFLESLCGVELVVSAHVSTREDETPCTKTALNRIGDRLRLGKYHHVGRDFNVSEWGKATLEGVAVRGCPQQGFGRRAPRGTRMWVPGPEPVDRGCEGTSCAMAHDR